MHSALYFFSAKRAAAMQTNVNMDQWGESIRFVFHRLYPSMQAKEPTEAPIGVQSSPYLGRGL